MCSLIHAHDTFEKGKTWGRSAHEPSLLRAAFNNRMELATPFWTEEKLAGQHEGRSVTAEDVHSFHAH